MLILAQSSVIAAADDGSFAAAARLSAATIPIDGQLNLEITLAYPEGYRPDSQSLRERLLSYNGFGTPPFSLLGETASKPSVQGGIQKQTLTFNLLPQSLGSHFLGPNTVTFLSDQAGGTPVTIPVEIFRVEVTSIAPSLLPEAMTAPLLGLEPELPVTLSYENKKNYLFGSSVIKRQTAAIAEAIESRSFPWLPISAASIVALAVVLILTVPSRDKGLEKREMDIDEQKAEIKKTLRELAALAPQSPESARAYFIKVEESLKQLLDAEFNLNTFTSTSEELANDISTLSRLSPHLKDKMISVFVTADKIKFARYRPDANDSSSAAEAAKQASEKVYTERD